MERLRRLCRDLVLERLAAEGLARLTLDFDGSVLVTSRWAEGVAKGFKRRTIGKRSYYPLFCTLAQTGQVFDALHRRGNVHDSNGAKDFIVACIEQIRAVLPGIQLAARLDGAFFRDAIVGELDAPGVEFTVGVPFERFVGLKDRVERRRFWRRLNAEVDYFESRWKPDCWPRRHRFVFLRTITRRRPKGPLQLDLFVPAVDGYRFTVVVTNKAIGARRVARFHHGRGAQEGILAEMKSQGQIDYIPTRALAGNQLYMLATVLAHNLNRELQMTVQSRQRSATPSRAPLWTFSQLQTLRQTHIQSAGRLTRPRGNLTLTISANEPVRNELLQYFHELQETA